ncbi:oligosaccharide flippase family protein [Candidatus Sumerlaeota bacterium]|nr:oligosaccharide flippase family protein [Candidatus Sumerlaeota bacterium]
MRFISILSRMAIARDTLAYWISQVANFALSFVTSVFVAVFLGPDHRGLVVAVLLANLLAVNLTNLGIQTVAMYFSGRERDRLPQIHAALLFLIGVLSCADWLLSYFGVDFIRAHIASQIKGLADFPWRYLALALAVLPFSLYFFAGQGILAGVGQVRRLSRFLFYYSVAANSVNLAFLGVFAGIWSWNPADVAYGLIMIWAGSQVAAAVVIGWMIARTPCRWIWLSPVECLSESRRLLSYGIRAFAGGYASSLVNRMDHLFILSAFGTVGIGIYSLAAKLAELVFQPSAAFENAGYAQVTGADRGESARLVRELFRSNLIINAMAVGSLMVCARPLILRFYTAEYAGAIAPLRILLPGTLFLAGSRMLALYFSAQLGKPQISSAVGWFAACINVPSLWWVVIRRAAGLSGAAWVTTGSYALMMISFWLLFAADTGMWNPIPYFVPQRRDWERLRKLLSGVLERRGI